VTETETETERKRDERDRIDRPHSVTNFLLFFQKKKTLFSLSRYKICCRPPAEKVLQAYAWESFTLPGQHGFPFNGFFEKAKDRTEVLTLLAVLVQKYKY